MWINFAETESSGIRPFLFLPPSLPSIIKTTNQREGRRLSSLYFCQAHRHAQVENINRNKRAPPSNREGFSVGDWPLIWEKVNVPMAQAPPPPPLEWHAGQWEIMRLVQDLSLVLSSPVTSSVIRSDSWLFSVVPFQRRKKAKPLACVKDQPSVHVSAPSELSSNKSCDGIWAICWHVRGLKI